MELKRIIGSKSVKLMLLLLSSLFIASVSASVYYTMYMNTTVGVAGNKVQFWPGTDFSTAGGTISNARQKVTFTSMDGQIGSLATISDPVNINDSDISNPHNIELKLDSWTGASQTHLYNITITMYNALNVTQGNSIVLVPTIGSGTQVTTTGIVSIPAGAIWRVQWGIYWNGAATISDTVNIDLLLVVSS